MHLVRPYQTRCVHHGRLVRGRFEVGIRSAVDQRPDVAHVGCLHVAPQLEIESNIESSLSFCSFKRLVSGGFNVGVMGLTRTAMP